MVRTVAGTLFALFEPLALVARLSLRLSSKAILEPCIGIILITEMRDTHEVIDMATLTMALDVSELAERAIRLGIWWLEADAESY
jgi:hypothetical protein